MCAGIWFDDPCGPEGREDGPSPRMVQRLQQGYYVTRINCVFS